MERGSKKCTVKMINPKKLRSLMLMLAVELEIKTSTPTMMARMLITPLKAIVAVGISLVHPRLCCTTYFGKPAPTPIHKYANTQ